MSFYDFRSMFFPYCLKKQDDGTYVVLNREYKPVGFIPQGSVNYGDYPVCVEIKGIRAATARKLSHNDSDDTDEIYLYNDGCNPIKDKEYMAAYLKKLELLAKKRIEFGPRQN
jgi:hypothetical protein